MYIFVCVVFFLFFFLFFSKEYFQTKCVLNICLKSTKMEAMVRDLTISTLVYMKCNATSNPHDLQPPLVPRHNIYDMHESLVGY